MHGPAWDYAACLQRSAGRYGFNPSVHSVMETGDKAPDDDGERIAAQLKQIDDIEEEFCRHAALRHVEREVIPHPTCFVALLHKAGSKAEMDMASWHLALEQTLMRLKLQIAWFNAYNVWSQRGKEDMLITFADA